MKKSNLLFAGIALFALNTQAAIVYTDITDVTLSSTKAAVSLDINNDATMDFDFTRSDYTCSTLLCYTVDIVTVGQAQGWDDIKPLAANAAIDANAGFYAQGDATINCYYGTTFPLNVDKFIGVRIIKANKTYYGWVRINVGTNSVTFKDYAYENTPDTQILAGDVGNTTAVSEMQNTVSIYPNPSADFINVSIEQNGGNKLLSIYSVDGRLCMQSTLSNQSNLIDIKALSNGLYYAVVLSNSGEKQLQMIVKN